VRASTLLPALALAALGGCNAILGLGDVRGAPDDAAPGTPDAPDAPDARTAPDAAPLVGCTPAPANTVVGCGSFTHLLADGTSVDVPRDFSNFDVAVYLPDAAAPNGFDIKPGTGTKDGVVTIPDVPDGMTFYLKLSDRSQANPTPVFYQADLHDLDLGATTVGRADAAPTTLQTQVTLALTGMQGWTSTDNVLIDSFTNGTESFYSGHPSAPFLDPPRTGDTTLGMTVDWLSGAGTFDGTPARLVDSSHGDDFWVVHNVSASISDSTNLGFTKATISDLFKSTDVTMTDGHPSTVSGAFQPVPQTPSQTVSLQMSQLTPAFVDGSHWYAASFECDLIKNWAVQSGNTIGPAELAISGDVTAFRSPLLTFPATSYGDPYPASWQTMMECQMLHYRFIKVPGATRVWNTAATIQSFVPTSQPYTLTPYVHPPDHVLVGGVNQLNGGAAAFDGTHPITVAWDGQPNVGRYAVNIFHVTVDVNRTQLTYLGGTFTSKTSTLVPAEFFTKGDFYLFDVIAYRDPNSYALGHLVRTGYPTGSAGAVTGIVRMSSDCGNGVVDGNEQCDTGGDSATCDADCSLRLCGDTYVNTVAGESCDTYFDAPGCDTDCTPVVCGDGHWNTAIEGCDDGNTTGGDGCSATCFDEQCGDGVMNQWEQCDDQNQVNGDGCTARCAIEGGWSCDTTVSPSSCTRL
jgi:cysteine-rich repeat protein